jgi:hypothetical protein
MAATRTRLGSLSDNSPPSSDISEGSETYEHTPDWQLDNGSQNINGLFINADNDLRQDSLSIDSNGMLTDIERGQVESFFSGLGTEVSFSRVNSSSFNDRLSPIIQSLD